MCNEQKILLKLTLIKISITRKYKEKKYKNKSDELTFVSPVVCSAFTPT